MRILPTSILCFCAAWLVGCSDERMPEPALTATPSLVVSVVDADIKGFFDNIDHDWITGFTHIFESMLPKLKARGVSEDEIHTLLVKNPARVFHGGYTY